MRMYLYYAWHSFVGVLRKLLRTWVAILIVVCLLFGVVVGLITASLDEAFPAEEETLTAEEAGDIPDPEIDLPPDEPSELMLLEIGELAAGAVVLVVLGICVFTGEKSGSHIFTMADVNLLFPAPKKPQSVLMFKLGTRLFTYLFVTLYIGLQMTNLLNAGFPPSMIIALLPAWFLLLVFGQLLSVLIYTLTAAREGARKWIRPVFYVIIGAVAGAFILYTRANGLDLWNGARRFFNAPASRFVPVWGWIKAIPFLAAEESWLWLGLDVAALVLTTALLIRFIWSMDADFYEDALGYAEQLDRATREAQENGKGFARLRKKERKTKERELSIGGEGAVVYFRKALFNRFRFSVLYVFSKTDLTYLLIAGAAGAFGRFLVKSDSVFFLAVPLLLAVFIRSFGNPILADSSKPFFLLIPEKTAKKVFWSHLGGTVNTLLDLIPAMILGVVLLRCDILHALLWFVLLVTVDFYAASFGVFTDFILPDAIPKQVKTGIQVMMIYFSVLPGGACVLTAALSGNPLFLLLAAGVNFLIGFALTSASGAILDSGKK